MIKSAQQTCDTSGDILVEKTIPISDLVPDCIADAGKVRQGGLHTVMRWLIGRCVGGGG